MLKYFKLYITLVFVFIASSGYAVTFEYNNNGPIELHFINYTDHLLKYDFTKFIQNFFPNEKIEGNTAGTLAPEGSDSDSAKVEVTCVKAFDDISYDKESYLRVNTTERNKVFNINNKPSCENIVPNPTANNVEIPIRLNTGFNFSNKPFEFKSFDILSEYNLVIVKNTKYINTPCSFNLGYDINVNSRSICNSKIFHVYIIFEDHSS